MEACADQESSSKLYSIYSYDIYLTFIQAHVKTVVAVDL